MTEYEQINTLSKYSLTVQADDLPSVGATMHTFPEIKGKARSRYISAAITTTRLGLGAEYCYKVWLTEEQAVLMKLKHKVTLKFVHGI